MKKVIFICFLTLSVCLCTPVGSNETQKQTEISTTHPTIENATTEKTAITKGTTTEKSTVTNPTPTNAITEGISTIKPTSQPTGPTKNDSKQTPTEASKDKSENTITVSPSKADKTTSTTTASTTKASVTVTTPKPDISSTTPSEKPKDDGVPIVEARGFDGASFIGGIILTLALLAAGFMGFKYYKNQTERNYHTL